MVDNTASVTTTNDGATRRRPRSWSSAPISPSKTPDGATVNAGDPVSFTIVVTNIGPGTAVASPSPTPCRRASTGIPRTTADCSISGAVGSEVLDCGLGRPRRRRVLRVTVSGTAATTARLRRPHQHGDGRRLQRGARSATTRPATIDGNCPDRGRQGGRPRPDQCRRHGQLHITVTNNGDGTAYDVTSSDTLPAGVAWDDRRQHRTPTARSPALVRTARSLSATRRSGHRRELQRPRQRHRPTRPTAASREHRHRHDRQRRLGTTPTPRRSPSSARTSRSSRPATPISAGETATSRSPSPTLARASPAPSP